MINKEQAVELGNNRVLRIHRGECKRTIGPRGGEKIDIETWRPNGVCQTWKSEARAHEYKLPIAHGLYEHNYLTHLNCKQFHLESECPLNA